MDDKFSSLERYKWFVDLFNIEKAKCPKKDQHEYPRMVIMTPKTLEFLSAPVTALPRQNNHVDMIVLRVTI